MLFRSEYKDESADYTNVWILGSPFLKAYYSVYNLPDQQIALVRVADATRARYGEEDMTGHHGVCTEA